MTEFATLVIDNGLALVSVHWLVILALIMFGVGVATGLQARRPVR